MLHEMGATHLFSLTGSETNPARKKCYFFIFKPKLKLSWIGQFSLFFAVVEVLIIRPLPLTAFAKSCFISTTHYKIG